jgi:hypothetical protein
MRGGSLRGGPEQIIAECGFGLLARQLGTQASGIQSRNEFRILHNPCRNGLRDILLGNEMLIDEFAAESSSGNPILSLCCDKDGNSLLGLPLEAEDHIMD